MQDLGSDRSLVTSWGNPTGVINTSRLSMVGVELVELVVGEVMFERCFGGREHGTL
jgi:hypothetical protein